MAILMLANWLLPYNTPSTWGSTASTQQRIMAKVLLAISSTSPTRTATEDHPGD